MRVFKVTVELEVQLGKVLVELEAPLAELELLVGPAEPAALLAVPPPPFVKVTPKPVFPSDPELPSPSPDPQTSKITSA